MKGYLDANVVIYFVERNLDWMQAVSARPAAIRAAGDALVLSDLHRLECLVGPLKSGDRKTLSDFHDFFNLPEIQVLPITAEVFERAAQARVNHGLKPLDALHIAAAIVNGCGQFLTNDAGLKDVPGIAVEIL